MLTIKQAKQYLKKLDIDLGPLRPHLHENFMVALPVSALSEEGHGQGDAALSPRTLSQILQSARALGETMVFFIEQYNKENRIYLKFQSKFAEKLQLFEQDEIDEIGDEIFTDLVASTNGSLQSSEKINARNENFLRLLHQSWCEVTDSVLAMTCEQNEGRSFLESLLNFYSATKTFEPISAERHDAKLASLTHDVASGSFPPKDLVKRKRGRPHKEEQVGANRDKFPVHTGQEWLAFLQTSSDGHYQRHFMADENRGVLRHHRPNAPFFTETMLLEEERRANFGMELLRQAAQSLDLDDGFIWLYIADAIAPTQSLAKGSYAGGWVDLDDVARRTLGGYAPNPAEVERRRRKVWHAIRYGARTIIGGERTIPYFDKSTGQTINTRLHTTPWQIVSQQKPVQPSLFPDDDAVPVRVELVASREWTALTTAADTAQFLPMGEILGAIPPGQPSGAWARSLGLAYFHWCRLNIHAALKGQSPPSRRELLDQFPSKSTGYEAILNSGDPGRALKYWKGAENFLRDAGIVEIGLEPPKPRARRGWKEPWLAQSPSWTPGTQLRPILEALSSNLYSSPPRALKRPRKSKRGSKNPPAASKSESTNE